VDAVVPAVFGLGLGAASQEVEKRRRVVRLLLEG
jgi:hypothetical protein